MNVVHTMQEPLSKIDSLRGSSSQFDFHHYSCLSPEFFFLPNWTEFPTILNLENFLMTPILYNCDKVCVFMVPKLEY